MAKFGYARVSTREQDPQTQVEQLRAAGCEQFYVEKASGYNDARPELARMLERLQPGDVVVVVQLARISRSVRHLLEIADTLQSAQVDLVSLTDSIDTTTASGRFAFTVLGAVAALECEMRRERQEAAWAAGKQKGRPTTVTPEQLALARRLHGEGATFGEIAKSIGRPKTTVYRALTKESAA